MLCTSLVMSSLRQAQLVRRRRVVWFVWFFSMRYDGWPCLATSIPYPPLVTAAWAANYNAQQKEKTQ